MKFIKQVTELRIHIDGIAQLTKELKPFWDLSRDELKLLAVAKDFQPREIDKAVDSLYLAKAWLGTMLQLLGEETPYKNDGSRKEVKDIEPVADKDLLMGKSLEENWLVDDNMELWSKKSHIEKVDYLREEIKDIIDNTEDFGETIDYIELEQGFVYKYLCEARFWLGFELQRIKESI